MANLNIPFLLLQPSLCSFEASISCSKLIPYTKYQGKQKKQHQMKSSNMIFNDQQLKQTFSGSPLLHGKLSIDQCAEDSNKNGNSQIPGIATTSSLYEFGKYSNFDDTPMNLVVLGDSKSGSIVLCHEEHYTSTKKTELNGVKQKQATKYLVNLIPRVLLVPSLSEDTGALLDYTLINSPAPNILVRLTEDYQLQSTSQKLLVSLHQDNRIRLWNTNDGRCIMTSTKDMLVTKGFKLKEMSDHPGNIMVIGYNRDMYIVNVYKMMVYKHFQYDLDGCIDCILKDKNLIICDQRGKVNIWKDESDPSPIKNTANSSLFELSQQQDEYETFSYTLEATLGDELADENDSMTLAFLYVSKEQLIIIRRLRLDFYYLNTRKTAFAFKKGDHLVFAKFLKVEEREMIMVINERLQLLMFDLTKLRHEILSHEQQNLNYNDLAIVDLNLIEDCKYFDHLLTKAENYHSYFTEPESIKQEFLDQARECLCQQIKQQDNYLQKIFRFSKGEMLLYALIKLNSNTTLLTWNFESLIENLNYAAVTRGNFKIPMTQNNIVVFQNQVENCPINFYSLVIKNIYNRHQYQFFFSDETVRDHLVYTSQDHPCLILGTSYGRIFMIPMFQESDEKIQPVILVDSHHQSPITQLFVVYEASRRIRHSKHQQQSNNHGSAFPKDTNLFENGGHLISLSEDGTLAVTNLSSGEIIKNLHNFTTSDKDKNRINQFFDEATSNRSQNRRNSFSSSFSVNQFYQMSKVKSQSVYSYSAFGKIDMVFEVKDIMKIQDQLIQVQQSKKQHGLTPDKKSEEDGMIGKKRNSFTGMLMLHQEAKSNPAYACVSDHGEVILIQLSNLFSSIRKLHGLDSPAIGVYSNEEINQYYVLTQSLTVFIYNKKSLILERKSDFKFAVSVLMIQESVEYLLTKNESFKFAKNGHSPLEFDSFEKMFKRKSLLMGLGSHKILDYLSLSLNLPLQYHPTTLYSGKYSKAIIDLLELKDNLADFFRKEEAQKVVLRAVNKCFIQSNLLFKSDVNEEFYKQQNGVSIVQSGPSIFQSRQQIIIVNVKKFLNVLKSKMIRIKNNRGGPSMAQSMSQFKQQRTMKGDDMCDNDYEEEKDYKPQLQNDFYQKTSIPIGRSSKFEKRPSHFHKIESETLFSHKWPTRLLSLIHPFNLDINVDETLEKFFGLNLPFLDFRLGVQGADESFSFLISKEDEEYHSERSSTTKMLRLLKLSQYSRSVRKDQKTDFMNDLRRYQDGVITDVIEFNISGDETEEPVRFFGSEYWKFSNYVSTVVPAFFLSTLVGIVEYSQGDVTYLLQEWLFILQRINQQKTINNNNGISLSVVSKLLLKKDPNISTTGRDIIMKPILYTLDMDQLKILIDEWSHLILETYKRLKKEPGVRSTYGQSNNGGSHIEQQHNTNLGQKIAQGFQNQFEKINHSAVSTSSNSITEKKMINQYFGELEIRGLVNISYFALYYFDQLDHSLSYRVQKLITILIREFVQKFTSNKRYIHLLTLLLQILSIWMKNQNSSFNNKLLISEVIKLLLFIYNINKSPLNKENVITVKQQLQLSIQRVNAENFHLIKPTQPDLYLKLSAARQENLVLYLRALLEIGENSTYDFLQIIQEEATHLNQGPEYQQNVLEVLKFFINGYGESLENHLIPLTQILLKCLDPNELALRKNSHKIISIILSVMVKMFPMVAFHHESQRLAVGTHDGPIAIYDVRTSAKWKILEGHSGNVTCLSFDSKGNLLASYSAVDLTVRLWKVGNIGFFSTIMGGTGKSANTVNLDPLKGVATPHHNLQNKKHATVQQQDMRSNNNLLDDGQQSSPTVGQTSGSGNNKRINRCSIKFMLPKEKSVQLIREDGQAQQIKLVK